MSIESFSLRVLKDKLNGKQIVHGLLFYGSEVAMAKIFLCGSHLVISNHMKKFLWGTLLTLRLVFRFPM